MIRNFIPLTRYPYRGSVVACPVCEHMGFEPVATFDRRWKRLTTVMCGRCGLLYTRPMPNEDELTSYYAVTYRRDYQFARHGPKPRHRAKRTAEATARADGLEGMAPAGGRVLDFGCGSGEFVEVMAARGYAASGFEPGASYGEDARGRLGERVTVARWQDLRFEAEFDVVTCFHVLEHLRDPMAALSAMAEWVKPDGLIYVEVPDMGSRPVKGIGGFHFAHVVGFNRHNLALAGARLGFGVRRQFGQTGLVFGRGGAEDQAVLAGRGLGLARTLYLDRSAVRSYFAYRLAKLGLSRPGPLRPPPG